jgi:hypothetical protein
LRKNAYAELTAHRRRLAERQFCLPAFPFIFLLDIFLAF